MARWSWSGRGFPISYHPPKTPSRCSRATGAGQRWHSCWRDYLAIQGCDRGPSESLLAERVRLAEVRIGQAMRVFTAIQCVRVKFTRSSLASFQEQERHRLQVWLRSAEPLPTEHLQGISRLALVCYYDIRCPSEVEIRDLADNHRLFSRGLVYSTESQLQWVPF